MIPVIISFVMGYLVGSIPFAYILTLRTAHVDIRRSGSGNVGGYNAYVVTNSKLTGIMVGVLDALKGLLAVLAAVWMVPNSYLTHCVALLGALAGHNYSIWLGLRGGRGLSTAAGGMLVLGAAYALVWSLVWIVAKKSKCDILESNLIAILATPPILWMIPWNVLKFLIAARVQSDTFLFFGCILSMVLLLSHLDALRAIWKGTKSKDAESS